MLFIIPFAIFTLLLTITENVIITVTVRLIITFSFLVIKFTRNTTQNTRYKLWIISLALLISLLSIFTKNYLYNKKIDKFIGDDALISKNMEWPQWSYFVWTWIISDAYSYEKYIFQDMWWREYLLNSSNDYKIWDVIRLNWYVSIWYTWSENIFNYTKQIKDLKDISFWRNLFHYEFDYPKWEMMKWFYWSIYEQNSIIVDDSWDNLSLIQKIRKWLQDTIISAYWKSHHAWLILWMLVWDKSEISSEDYQWFIDSWLVHIIAVSGWNIVMLIVFLSAILFFLPFYARNAVILLFVIFYSMICGLDSSVFRATIMWSLSLLAIFRWREINIWRAMWFAFVIMLVVNPYFLAYDVWFLLSFSAIIGIIFFWKFVEKIKNKKIENKKITWKKIKESKIKNFWNKVFSDYISPTLWATLWVLPIMLFFMWWTNLLWIIANFFVSPIIAIVMIYGFISTILFKVFPLNIWLWPEKILIDYIYLISDLTVRWWVYLQAIWNWIKYAILILFIIRFVIKKTKQEIK